ncbi:MAG: dimethyl sulfoxide reductase anchor subunit [Litoreibacter sp.]|nr:dimethyl sulfoxide reductase anchor subunit [Litoreibacter sp.]
MHPAPSIIFFTVFSGLGFGMLTFLGLGKPDVSGFTAFVFFAIAFALAVAGLAASAFHLGNPQRALKAFTQWRSSWLSREACLSVAALSVMAFYAIGVVRFDNRIPALGLIGAGLSLLTVFTTSMIYAQLKTVPRWNQWSTPALFLLYALTGGAFLTGQTSILNWLFPALTLMQIFAWVQGDKLFADSGTTLETATGLGHIGKVRLFEAPHTSGNYLTKEMVHVVGRKHVPILRVIGLLSLSVLPWAGLTLLPFNHVLALVTVLLHIIGAVTIRWLFFAQAEHTVGLYYGKR